VHLDRALGQRNAREFVQYSRNPPHRNPDSVVQRVGRSHHARSDTVGGRAGLIGRQTWCAATHRLPAVPASAHRYPVSSDHRARTDRQISGRSYFFSLLLQVSATMWTAFQRRYDDRFSSFLKRRRTTGKRSLSGFAARRFGILDALPFGEWRGLSLAPTPQLLDLLPKFRDLPLLVLDHPLLSRDYLDQSLSAQRCQIGHTTS
jgi:hypothetical protein